MSRNTVHEGWLTKSPPNRRIWRTRWRRRWFSLRQSGELPGQYFLDYYADRNCRRLKGTIDLDLCEQVDAGLRMERNSHAPFNPKIRGSVFTIQTQRRTYHLEADCEAEMEKWVYVICRACKLCPTSAPAEDVAIPLTVIGAKNPKTTEAPPGPPPEASELVVIKTVQQDSACPEMELSCYSVTPSEPSKDAVELLESERSRRAVPTAGPSRRAEADPIAGPSRRAAVPTAGPSRRAEADPIAGPSRRAAVPTAGPSRRAEADPIAGPSRRAVKPQRPPIKIPETYQNSVSAVSPMNENYYESIDGTGPYIPISECITGVRAQDEQRAFTFDTKNIMMSTRHDGQQLYSSQSHFRLNSAELSENESNMSDEEEVSLHASHQNIIDWSVTKSFTKLSVAPKKNEGSEDGPPVPPRPPKTLAFRNCDVPKDAFQGPKIQECIGLESPIQDNAQQQQRLRVPRRMSQGAPTSPGRLLVPALLRTTDDEEETSPMHASMQYCNLPSLPPAVDRALKPRHSSVSVGHINAIMAQGGFQHYADEMKPDTLQYLDLDLHTSKPSPSKGLEQRTVDDTHGKSVSAAEADSAYKTVDFLKTEAFNITRQDAEASRSFQY